MEKKKNEGKGVINFCLPQKVIETKGNEVIDFCLQEIKETKPYSCFTLPDPLMVSYYKDLKNRTIYIEDHSIDPESDDNLILVMRQITNFNREDDENNLPIEQRNPIRLMIYTYGGGLDLALSFVSFCLLSKTPIYTYNMGLALSAGFLILLAGHKRFAFPNSQVLIHNGSGGSQGTAHQAEAQIEQYKKTLERIKYFILNRTKINKKLYNAKEKLEWYLWADELIQYGIVDEIITDTAQLYNYREEK